MNGLNKKKSQYCFSERERDKAIKAIRGAEVTRFKGLGEMNVEELAECALDPETRILRRLTMEEGKAAKNASKLFDVLMGSDVALRREYLIANSSLLDPDALDV